MGHLPKHLRPRWRYLGLELETSPSAAFDRSAFQQALWARARSLVGDVTTARLELSVVRFALDAPVGTAVVRTHRGEVSPARAVTAVLGDVSGTPIRAAVRGVSGTIRACEENYLRIAREPQSREDVALDAVTSPAVIRSPKVDLPGDSAIIGATTLDIG